MGKIKGTLVCFCISFLAVSWPNGVLGAPSCDPLRVQSYYPSSSTSGDASAIRRQQLLNQAKILLDQLSSPTLDCSADVPGIIPADVTESNYALETLETSLLSTLINRLNALKSNSVIAANPTSSLVISDATLTSLVNQYQQLKVLIANCIPAQDNQVVQSALDDLHNTIARIITGKLTKAELPNLCSKLITFNARLVATNAPAKVRDAVNDHIKSLTLALTGQSEVTISAVCSCLNDLETSVVTVVESDAPKTVQQLLANLVNAVTNVVISGGDVGCNVINVVKRYVASIDQAIQQDGSARAKQIYKSVLSFEDELYKALIHSEPKDVAVASPSSHGSASENSASTVTQIGTTSPRVPSDATTMVSNGGTFIIKELLVTEIDDHGNVAQVVQSGTYQIFDPSTNAPSFGSFAVQDGTIESTPDGGIYLKSYGVYDVVSPSSSDKLQGNFAVEFNAVVQVDENENPQLVESGIYTVTDSALGITKSGKFILVNSISTTNPDGSTEIIKTGVLSVDGCDATSTSEQPSVDSDGVYCLFTEQRSQSPNSAGECGRGVFNIKKIRTGETESGTLVVSSSSTTTNSDGSVDQTTSGVYYVDGVGTDFVTAHYDPSLIIMHGCDFTFTVNEAYVKDSNGIVRIVRKGLLVETDPITGIRKSGTSIFLNTMKTKNLDGSTTLVAFSKVNSDFQTIVSGADPSTATTSSSGSMLPLDSAKPLTTTKDSLQALINSLHRGKAVEPASASGTQTSSTTDYPAWDATTILSDNTAFIITELATPILDEQGEVIDRERTGTYFFQNSLTKTSWTGPFDVTDFSVNTLPSGQIVVAKAGKFTVKSPDDDLTSNEVQYSIINIANPKVDTNGITTISEGGSYVVSVLGKGLTKSGTYVVTNRLAKPRSDGAIETTTAGLLFVNNPDGSASKAYIDRTECDRYSLTVDRFFNTPDPNGNLGTGVYSFKDPNSNEQITGTSVIKTLSTEDVGDGSTVTTTQGVVYVDGSDSDSNPNSKIINGAQYSIVDTSPDNTAIFTQFDPETGAILSSYDIHVFSTDVISNSDGSKTVRKFGGLIDNGNSKNSQTKSSDTASVADASQLTTTNSNSESQTVATSMSQMATSNRVADSSATFIDPVKIATDGTSFIINKYFFPERDVTGNIISIHKWGEFSLMDPKTNISYTGSFWAEKSSTASPAPGRIDTSESGTFVVNPPRDGSGHGTGLLSINLGYSYQEHVHKFPDSDGDFSITDEGTYTLFNPVTIKSAIGSFVVENSFTKTNPDGSTIVVKSGILSSNTYCSTSSSTHAQTTTIDKNRDTAKLRIDPTAIVSNEQAFVITKYSVPKLNSLGKRTNTLKSGDFYLEGSNKGTSWKGRFFVNHAPTSSPAQGETITSESGTYLVDASNDGTTTTNPDKKVNYSLEEHVIESVDDEGTCTTTDTGTFSLSNPITNCYSDGTFVVEKTYSKTYNNGTTVIKKSGKLYVTNVYTAPGSESVTSITDQTTTNNQVPVSQTCTETPLEPDRGYFLFNDHIFATPDANGNKGIGFYSINDPKNEEYTTGTYVLEVADTVTNPDGTEDSITSGTIYVDSDRSSSRSVNSDPTLAIINGAKFSFDDHLTDVTDPNGNVHKVGNGVLTQTDPNTGVTRFGNYQILDILTIDNADGSTDIIESGTFKYTDTGITRPLTTSSTPSNTSPKTSTGSPQYTTRTSTTSRKTNPITSTGSPQYTTRSSTTSRKTSPMPWTGSSRSTTRTSTSSDTSPAITNLIDLAACLETLTATLNALKSQAEQKHSSTVVSTSSGSNSHTASSASAAGLLSADILVPITDVVAAADGQSLSTGDLVVVAANNGDALVGTIEDSCDTVTFRVINSVDLAQQIAACTRFVTVPENNFPMQYRTQFDNLLNAVRPPCDS